MPQLLFCVDSWLPLLHQDTVEYIIYTGWDLPGKLPSRIKEENRAGRYFKYIFKDLGNSLTM